MVFHSYLPDIQERLGAKVSIETADDSFWQNHVQQFIEAEQNVQIQAHFSRYDFSVKLLTPRSVLSNSEKKSMY